MSVWEAAIIVTWIAVALLSFGFAMLVRQTAHLTRAAALQYQDHRVANNPVVGLRLPVTTGLEPWLGSDQPCIVLFVSMRCRSCNSYLEQCLDEPGFAGVDHTVLVVSSSECPLDRRTLPAGWVCLEDAAAEHQRIGVVATPYFALIDSDRRIQASGLVPAPAELVLMRDSLLASGEEETTREN